MQPDHRSRRTRRPRPGNHPRARSTNHHNKIHNRSRITHESPGLDGKSIPDGKGETVRFSLDRTDYEIDLTDKNAKALRDAFATYVSATRRKHPPQRPWRGR